MSRVAHDEILMKKILLIIEQCNPDWASVPLVGYHFYNMICQIGTVTLVTHARNREALEKVRNGREIVYIDESPALGTYYRFMDKLVNRGAINWPLYHMLSYPVYAEFNNKVSKRFAARVVAGDFDLVHAITPMMPRYPVKISKVCNETPFILGPVNGGVPFPKGFETTARKENAHLNFIRDIGRWLLSDYKKTYHRARVVLSGSSYTQGMITETLGLPAAKVRLMYENALSASYFTKPDHVEKSDRLELLFAGRLVPYKGADMLLDALAKLPASYLPQLRLTIVGDGSEKTALEDSTRQLGLQNTVRFTGWAKPADMPRYYHEADVFCFPSIREFGGAVVLEAMAAGLPCVVVNNGGIGEYVVESAGFKIEPHSRQYIVDQLASIIQQLLDNRDRVSQLSAGALERAKYFTWEQKQTEMRRIYDGLLAS